MSARLAVTACACVIAACGKTSGGDRADHRPMGDASLVDASTPQADAATSDSWTAGDAVDPAPFGSERPLVAPRACTSLREWTLHPAPTVVNGADGFAAFVDATSVSLAISAYSVSGDVLLPVGSLAWSPGPFSFAIEQVSAGAGLTALTAGCYYKFRCGEALLIQALPAVSLDDGQDATGAYRNAVAVRRDRRVILSQTMPSGADYSERVLSTALLDASGAELRRRDVSTGGLDLVKQLVVLNDHLALILANPTRFDERPTTSVLWLLDGNFDKVAEWQAPQGVALFGMDTAQDGSLVLVGSTQNGEASPETTWVHALTLPALADAWPAPQLGGGGRFEDVDAARNALVVAGSTALTLWLDILGADGVASSATRPSVTLDSAAYRAGVQVQSDGSILLSTTRHGYVCE